MVGGEFGEFAIGTIGRRGAKAMMERAWFHVVERTTLGEVGASCDARVSEGTASIPGADTG